MNQLLSVGDVARRTGRGPDTVRLWEKRGKLPALRTESGMRLFRREDVDRLIEERAAKKGAPIDRP